MKMSLAWDYFWWFIHLWCLLSSGETTDSAKAQDTTLTYRDKVRSFVQRRLSSLENKLSVGVSMSWSVSSFRSTLWLRRLAPTNRRELWAPAGSIKWGVTRCSKRWLRLPTRWLTRRDWKVRPRVYIHCVYVHLIFSYLLSFQNIPVQQPVVIQVFHTFLKQKSQLKATPVCGCYHCVKNTSEEMRDSAHSASE